MQSELSSHIGLRGKLFCRICNVKGSDVETDARKATKAKAVAPDSTVNEQLHDSQPAISIIADLC